MPPGYSLYLIILERNLPSMCHSSRLTRTQYGYDPIPNGYCNPCFGHNRQVFHFTCGMKNENFVGIRTKAAISTSDIVCDKQIQVLCYQLGLRIRYEVMGLRREPNTYQAFSCFMFALHLSLSLPRAS